MAENEKVADTAKADTQATTPPPRRERREDAVSGEAAKGPRSGSDDNDGGRESARRTSGKSDARETEKRSELDFDVTQPVSVLGGFMEEGTSQPEPFAQYSTMDTSGTGGEASMDGVTPVFREARARALVTAARALDPADTRVPRELVTLPGDGESSVDEAKEVVFKAAKDAVTNPIEVGGLSPAQQEAAEEYDDSTEPRASLGGQAQPTDDTRQSAQG